MRVLIVPGLNGSGPDHWQTHWEHKYGYERVQQRDWEKPDVAEWVKTLNATIVKRPERVVIVAHSLGCLAVTHWVRTYPENAGRVQCAMLVTPPDVLSSEPLRHFALQEPLKLPFPSLLVGSENDPYMTPEKAQDLARLLGSRFVNAGQVGHINVDSGHGPWPQGETWLQELILKNFKKEIKHNGRFRNGVSMSMGTPLRN